MTWWHNNIPMLTALAKCGLLIKPHLAECRIVPHFAAVSSTCESAVLSSSMFVYDPLANKLSARKCVVMASSAPASADLAGGESENAKLAQVAKGLEKTARYFKRLGSLGFWGSLYAPWFHLSFCPSQLWSLGRLHLLPLFMPHQTVRKAKETANDPSKAPPRADVVKSLKNGIIVNLLGMGAAILCMQATVGFLVAKALTSSANPYQGISTGYSPILALDVFLVQASANTILSHFLGLVFSLELLRSVTIPTPENIPVTKYA